MTPYKDPVTYKMQLVVIPGIASNINVTNNETNSNNNNTNPDINNTNNDIVEVENFYSFE